MTFVDSKACLVPFEERRRLRQEASKAVCDKLSRKRFWHIAKILTRDPRWNVELTEDERPYGENVTFWHNMQSDDSIWSKRHWLHGGLAGRLPVDFLLPPNITGSNPRHESAGNHRAFVYVTKNSATANRYACHTPKSVIYECQPEGPVLPEAPELRALMIVCEVPDYVPYSCHKMAAFIEGFTCKKAKVVCSHALRLDWLEEDYFGWPRSNENW